MSPLRGQVRLVRVLGDHAECLLLARAADHDRDLRQRGRRVDRVAHLVVLAVEAHLLVAQHRYDDLQRLLELLEPVGEGAELVAEGVVLEFEPARSDAERRPATRDVVERRDGLREQRRVTVGVAGHQRREPDLLGVLGQRGQHRVALEHRLVWGADPGKLVEVVHHEDPIEAGGLGCLGLRHDVLEDVGAVDAWVGEVRDLVAESSHAGAPACAWADGSDSFVRNVRSRRLTYSTECVKLGRWRHTRRPTTASVNAVIRNAMPSMRRRSPNSPNVVSQRPRWRTSLTQLACRDRRSTSTSATRPTSTRRPSWPFSTIMSTSPSRRCTAGDDRATTGRLPPAFRGGPVGADGGLRALRGDHGREEC